MMVIHRQRKHNLPPRTAADLQAVMLEELEVVQAKIRAHPVDWRRGFFDDAGRPRGEEECREEVLKMLGEFPAGVACAPEGHLAQDKRADIVCTIGELMLPIEVKGQWHSELWSAAAGAARPALYDRLARQRPRHLPRAVVRFRSRWRSKPEGPSRRRAEAHFRP